MVVFGERQRRAFWRRNLLEFGVSLSIGLELMLSHRCVFKVQMPSRVKHILAVSRCRVTQRVMELLLQISPQHAEEVSVPPSENVSQEFTLS